MSGLVHGVLLDNCIGPTYVLWSLDDRLLVRRTALYTTGNPRPRKRSPMAYEH